MLKHQIILKIQPSGLVTATHTDPKVIDAFGCDTLPTPYVLSGAHNTPETRAQVLRNLKSLNPGCIVAWDAHVTFMGQWAEKLAGVNQ